MRKHIADILLISGAASISFGAGILHTAAGLIALGVFCIAGGFLLARST